MTDGCQIRRGGGALTTDPETGEVTEAAGAPLYLGACRVQVTTTAPEQSDAGEVRFQLLSVVVSVPVDGTVYEQGDVVQVTRSQNDPALVGRRFRVESVVFKSHATARRLLCEEGVP